MSRALRTGFLVSGLLHVAVVAAITLSPRPEAAAVAEDAPITLRLAMFEPPAPVPVVPEVPEPPPVEPPPPEPLPPEPVVAEPPPPEPMIPEPPPEDEPEPAPTPEPEPEPPPPPSPVARPPKPRPPVAARRPAPPRPTPVPRPAAPSPPAAAAVMARTEAPRPVDPDARQHYLAALAARINRNKFYPRASRRLGEEGTVVVSFVIQRSGELTDLEIVESSGHRRLDEAALATLRRASPFREIPDTVAREQWPIRVPIAFGLRD